MNDNRDLAIRALEIMDIDYPEEEDLSILLMRIRYAVTLAASSTELAIRSLSQRIADHLEQHGDRQETEHLLEELAFEVSFLLWD